MYVCMYVGYAAIIFVMREAVGYCRVSIVS